MSEIEWAECKKLKEKINIYVHVQEKWNEILKSSFLFPFIQSLQILIFSFNHIGSVNGLLSIDWMLGIWSSGEDTMKTWMQFCLSFFKNQKRILE